LRAAGDEYGAILLAALSDRIAEAFAEYLHQRARIETGTEVDGTFDNAALIAEKFRGIRPAPGYPACPEHREKLGLFDLLDAGASAGMSLTESFMMEPPSSVCGYYLFHPDASYFAVGKIGRDQLEAYSKRAGEPLEVAEKWLSPYLAYTPDSK